MSSFVPPFPPRLRQSPSAWQRLKIARQNIVAMWEDGAFDVEFSTSRMFTRRVFLCNSPASVQFAFNLKNTSFERKSAQMRHALTPLLGDGLFVSDGDTWRERRSIVAPIIHISRLSYFAPTMVETAREICARWGADRTHKVDMLAESAMLTAEVICRTLFGQQLGREYARAIVEGFSEYQRHVGQLDFVSLLGLPEWFPRWQPPAARRAAARIHGVLDEIIARCRASRGDEHSMIGSLLNASNAQGGPLDDVAIRNEVAVLFMAGHETTANALAWTWFLLSQSPEHEARLHAEIDAVIGNRPATLSDAPKLVFTRALLDEVMRLYPPVPLLPRESLRDEIFETTAMPKGSIILVSPWLLHRHRKLWDRPDHFIPERFLPENVGSVPKFGYIPFSIGPRICAGMAFGLTEAVLCIATLAQHFRFRLEQGHIVELVCRLTLRPGDVLPMTLEPRMPVIPASEVQANMAGCPFGHG